MNVTGKTLAVTAIATLVVGSFLGAWYGVRRDPNSVVLAAKRPTYQIRVEVENGGRAVLAPAKNDTVEWWTQATSTTPSQKVNVQFVSWTPCNEGFGPLSFCTINAYGLYKYQCVSPIYCDPGIDPNSTTEGTILRFQPKSGGVSTPVTAATGPEPLTVTIGCDASNNPKPDTDPLPVSKGQVISWIAGSIPKFTIHVTTQNNVQFCKESASGNIPADPNAVCTVMAPVGTAMTYTVDGVCTKNLGTFNANVTQ